MCGTVLDKGILGPSVLVAARGSAFSWDLPLSSGTMQWCSGLGPSHGCFLLTGVHLQMWRNGPELSQMKACLGWALAQACAFALPCKLLVGSSGLQVFVDFSMTEACSGRGPSMVASFQVQYNFVCPNLTLMIVCSSTPSDASKTPALTGTPFPFPAQYRICAVLRFVYKCTIVGTLLLSPGISSSVVVIKRSVWPRNFTVRRYFLLRTLVWMVASTLNINPSCLSAV